MRLSPFSYRCTTRCTADRLIESVCRNRYTSGASRDPGPRDSVDEHGELPNERSGCSRPRAAHQVPSPADGRVTKRGRSKPVSRSRAGVHRAVDADFIPPHDFPDAAVPHSPSVVGMVQARWGHINQDYSLRPDSVHSARRALRAEHGAGAAAAAFSLQRHGRIWRRATIDDAGGWQTTR